MRGSGTGACLIGLLWLRSRNHRDFGMKLAGEKGLVVPPKLLVTCTGIARLCGAPVGQGVVFTNTHRTCAYSLDGDLAVAWSQQYQCEIARCNDGQSLPIPPSGRLVSAGMVSPMGLELDSVAWCSARRLSPRLHFTSRGVLGLPGAGVASSGPVLVGQC